MAFSIRRTIPTLLNFDDNTNDKTIYCIYGLKGLATIFLYFSFKFLQIGHLTFTNRAHLTEVCIFCPPANHIEKFHFYHKLQILDSPPSIFIRASFLYMEVFLLTSGFFAGYKMSEDLEHRRRIPWIRRYLGRFIRLTPSFLAVILFTAWIWPHVGSGPQWGNLVVQNSKLCQENFWTNLLYLQNWLPFHEQCVPHLQQLSVDVQLFLLAPLFVWLFQNNVVVGVGAFGIVHAFSAAIRYSGTITERLSYIVFHGMKLV